jgi:DNA-binding transcriptional MocR family regulator
MAVKFARRMNHLRASEIRELLKVTARPEVISLAGGLPAQLDARKVLAACLERDVASVPGGSFFPNGGHENTLRLNYSNMPEDRIDEGVSRLGVLPRELLGDDRNEKLAVAG